MKSTPLTSIGGSTAVHNGDDLPNIHGRLVAEARVGGVSLSISEHTVERWAERVKPSLSPDFAIDDLVRVISVGGDLRYDGPDWASKGVRDYAGAWIWIGDGIALPLDQQRDHVVAFTVVTRGGLGETARLRRSQKKRQSAKPTRLTTEVRERGPRQRVRRITEARRSRSLERRWGRTPGAERCAKR